MKMRLTKLEKSWILYDIANSAFILLVATLLPIYFDYLAAKGNLSESDYLAYWGYAGSVATVLVAIIGPAAPWLTNGGSRNPCSSQACWWVPSVALLWALPGVGCRFW